MFREHYPEFLVRSHFPLPALPLPESRAGDSDGLAGGPGEAFIYLPGDSIIHDQKQKPR